ncbi:hypothetical protein ACLUWI_03265 [Limosilactobacillus mucosae]|uniref:hypothetical protein n=1 Tax=Limosilactobacillus mucosae TaxID=97478 RepID=UPI00265E5088|nr:hypothetical protein [Limosilactobacillus mucosae]
MVEHRQRPIFLVTKTLMHGLLDDTEKYSFKMVMAHVTEVNGAELQTNLFGKRYQKTWIARIRGTQKADYVTFPDGSKTPDELKRYKIIQLRKHAMRTDIYFADDTETTANG